MIGHVEAVEPGLGIGDHCRSGRVGIERLAAPLHVGDLPQAGDHAADLEAGRQGAAIWDRLVADHASSACRTVAGEGRHN